MTGQWQVTEEFSQRLGCGMITAVALPLWFAVIFLAVGGRGFVVTVSAALLVAALAGGAIGFRRIRTLPRTIRLDEDGTVTFESPARTVRLPAADVEEVVVGSSLGIKPVRLRFRGGRRVQVSRDLDDLSGFIDALRAHQPAVVVVDRSGP